MPLIQSCTWQTVVGCDGGVGIGFVGEVSNKTFVLIPFETVNEQ